MISHAKSSTTTSKRSSLRQITYESGSCDHPSPQYADHVCSLHIDGGFYPPQSFLSERIDNDRTTVPLAKRALFPMKGTLQV